MDAADILGHLDQHPQNALNLLDKWPAIVFTPVGKRWLHIEGWDKTGCVADGRGWLVRDAQHSTDGFWTADIRIEFIRIQGQVRWSQPPKFFYIRLEIEPRTSAHAVAWAQNPIKKDWHIAFQGPVLWDHDRSFLEVHPTYVWLLDDDLVS